MTLLSEVLISDTFAFVTSCLASKPRQRILEVGCGSGELAAALHRLGHDVVAIDSDEAVVQTCIKNGVTAIKATWPDFEAEPFDAVLFIRSLHHLTPLDSAVRQASRLLRPYGVLIVEDFAFSLVRPPDIAWFVSVLRLLEACDLLNNSADQFASKILEGDASTDAWMAHHDHDLHTAPTMEKMIRDQFLLKSAEHSPYFYRYIAPVLKPTDGARRLLKTILESERILIREGVIQALGQRWTSHRKPA